jgi:hypothetical protein
MPTITGPIQHDGALVNVEVGLDQAAVAALRAKSQAVPPAILKVAVIDTGCETTTLDTAVVQQMQQQLGLQYLGVNPVAAPGLGIPVGLAVTYSISLVVLNSGGQNLVRPTLLVQEMPIGQLGYDILIGRDLLEFCRFVYEGRNRPGQFELTY